MSFARRLAKVAERLGRDDPVPRWMIVFKGRDGRWRVDGKEIDPATIDPRTRVVVLGIRPDGPQ
jgi:hypothetical protein